MTSHEFVMILSEISVQAYTIQYALGEKSNKWTKFVLSKSNMALYMMRTISQLVK